MSERPDPSAEPRVPLNRERVLRAAITLADQGGIASLSMRKLAEALGVQAMSLYYHVTNKDDLFDGMVDIVMSEVAMPSSGADWKEAIRRSAISAHDALRRHPWACGLIMSPKRTSLVRLRHMDWLLGRLRAAGFSPGLTYHAYHALDSHILGFTLWEAGHSFAAEELSDLVTTFFQEFPADEYPHLAEHAQQHLTGSGDDDVGGFEFALDLILDGLERLRSTN